MASSVQVLCPNGHRVNIKITPNTTILQILEEACMKKGFSPAEQYELKHGRKTLDITQTIRYSGLPNLAKLELVKASTIRAESKVTIALQLEDGERLQQEFSPNTALWEILQHWENTSEGKYAERFTKSKTADHHPVCIYMREEIVGEFALKETSLRSLGLTGGKAILRFLHRAVNEETLANIKMTIEKKKSMQHKLSSQSSSAQKSAGSTSSPSPSSTATGQLEASNAAQTTDTNLPPDSSMAESMEMEVVSVKSSSSTEITSSCEPMDIGSADALDQLSQIPGVQVFRPGPPVTGLSQQEQQMVSSISQALSPQLAGARPKPQHTKPSPQFASQPTEFKFPESTKGKDLYHNELSEVNKEEYRACNREMVLFNLNDHPQSEHKLEQENIPDDFFEVTEADLRLRMKELTKNVTEMSEGGMLMTSVMRRAQLEQKLDRYERCIIRVYFPDKHILQGVFRPRETVHALKKFVIQNLEDKDIAFYLYTTPPKCVLKDKAQMLGEANLIPMAVVHFGSEILKDTYLSQSALSNKSTQSSADTVVMRIMTPEEKTTSDDKVGARTSVAVKRGEPSKKSPPSDEGKKVPKWFVMGKK